MACGAVEIETRRPQKYEIRRGDADQGDEEHPQKRERSPEPARNAAFFLCLFFFLVGALGRRRRQVLVLLAFGLGKLNERRCGPLIRPVARRFVSSAAKIILRQTDILFRHAPIRRLGIIRGEMRFVEVRFVLDRRDV